jgi:ribosome maturation factor RimP
MKRFLGHYCKIVYRIAGDRKKAVTGDIVDFNKAGFIVLENQEGVHYLNSRKIVSIKPREKNRC